MNTDFLLIERNKSIEIEVGGKSKKRIHLKNMRDAYIFKDGIEIGSANTIPLYLAGFLY